MIYEGDKKFTKLAKVGNFDGFWIVIFFFLHPKISWHEVWLDILHHYVHILKDIIILKNTSYN